MHAPLDTDSSLRGLRLGVSSTSLLAGGCCRVLVGVAAHTDSSSNANAHCYRYYAFWPPTAGGGLRCRPAHGGTIRLTLAQQLQEQQQQTHCVGSCGELVSMGGALLTCTALHAQANPPSKPLAQLSQLLSLRQHHRLCQSLGPYPDPLPARLRFNAAPGRDSAGSQHHL